jgi:GYD domain
LRDVDGGGAVVSRSSPLATLWPGGLRSSPDIYWTLGAHDIVGIVDAPDDQTLAAALLAVAGQGNIRTTTLRTVKSFHVVQRLLRSSAGAEPASSRGGSCTRLQRAVDIVHIGDLRIGERRSGEGPQDGDTLGSDVPGYPCFVPTGESLCPRPNRGHIFSRIAGFLPSARASAQVVSLAEIVSICRQKTTKRP